MANIFPNLYFYVEIKKTSGTWYDEDNNSVTHFAFASIPKISGYRTSTRNVIDKADLNLSPINNGFQDNVWENGLAKIGVADFSISNLELWYHKIVEKNNNNINLFLGNTVSIYMCNGFTPGNIWNVGADRWDDLEGNSASTSDKPSAYYTTDRAQLLFKGIINNISFSSLRTSFDCMALESKRNTQIGTLADVRSTEEYVGKIIPIVYGDHTTDGALVPVIVDRAKAQLAYVPKVIIDTQPILEYDHLRIYDANGSKRDFEIDSVTAANTDNNQITFRDETTGVATGQTNSISVNDWSTNNIAAIKEKIVADDISVILNCEAEQVSIHCASADKFSAFNQTTGLYTIENGMISRGWGDTARATHTASAVEEYADPDNEAKKFQLRVKFQLKCVNMVEQPNEAPSGYCFTNNVSESASGRLAIVNEFGRKGGSVWDMSKNSDAGAQTLTNPPRLSAQANKPSSYGFTGTKLGLQKKNRFKLFWDKLGFTGTVIDAKIRLSALWRTVQTTATASINSNRTCFIVKAVGWAAPGSDEFLYAGSAVPDVDSDAGFSDSPNSISYADVSIVTAPYSSSAIIATELLTFERIFDDSPIDLYHEAYVEWRSNTSTDCWQSYLKVHGIRLDVTVLVDSEPVGWFARCKGRDDSGSLIESPVDVLSNLIKKETNTTPTISNHESYPVDWKVAGVIFGERPNLRDLIARFCRQFGLVSWASADDMINFSAIQVGGVDFAITKEMLLIGSNNLQDVKYSYTGTDSIYNRVEVKYKKNYANGNYKKTIYIAYGASSYSQAPWAYLTATMVNAMSAKCAEGASYLGLAAGEYKPIVIEADFIRDDATAELLMQHYVNWYTTPKAIVTVLGSYNDFYLAELGYNATINVDGLPQAIRSAQFLIIEKTIIPAMRGSSSGFGIELKLLQLPE